MPKLTRKPKQTRKQAKGREGRFQGQDSGLAGALARALSPLRRLLSDWLQTKQILGIAIGRQGSPAISMTYTKIGYQHNHYARRALRGPGGGVWSVSSSSARRGSPRRASARRGAHRLSTWSPSFRFASITWPLASFKPWINEPSASSRLW